jgi:hypothetical protein
MFKARPNVLVMLMAMSLVFPFRVAHATEPAPVVIAGGPKFRRPQLKKPGSSGSTTSQGTVAQGKSTSGQPYSNQTRQQLEKSKRSYEELIQKIIEGRVRELETQIEKQRSELKKIDEALRALPSGD